MKKKMSNNTNTQETTFWNFLTNNTIEIPFIQRDYAQGRLGKEYLRKSFLTDIKNALYNALKNNGVSKMKLDFVYGSVENGKMSPLDGQQRLTTLWLLHWYIALMSGNLNEDICKILVKFTYETRISSREFCQNLCKPKNFANYIEYKSTQEDRKVVEYITSRTWFYSAWKQDPTIQSMLRMLGGTEINDKKGEDIVDGLEEIFKNTRDFGKYWDCLISEKAPIVFYQLPLENFGLSDDLYIKMNARGKQLTNFENFKADLVGYIREHTKDNQDWDNLLDAKNGIPIKMDTTWTDIFWKNKSKDNRIDEIYFAFLNRFLLSELICQKENNDYIYSAEKLEKENSTFKYLYGKESNDANIEYVGWEKYGCIPLSYFNDLSTVLDNHIVKFKEFFPKWANKGSQFQFIPEYKENNVITNLTRSERVVFHAISKYLQKGDFDVESFKQWMRIVWNIVENANINSIATMIGSIRLIDELGEHSHIIYEFLASENLKIKSEVAKDQVKEEIAKAKLILKKKYSETDIIDAESHPLLKGCISAIFENEDCYSVSFGQSIQDRIKLLDGLWKKENEKDYTLVKVLISLYDKEEPNGKFYLKKNHENWKSLLTDKLKDSFRKIEKKDDKGDCMGWISMLANTNLIENSRDSGKIVSTYRDRIVVLWATGGCTWNAYGNVILDDVHNNSILVKLVNNDIIECNQKIPNCEFFDGWNIDFKYKHYFFRWYCYPKDNPDNENRKELDVYFMVNDWKDYLPRKEKTFDNNTENETHYCFKVTSEMKTNTTLFTKGLDKLIDEAKQNGDLQAIEKQ